MFRKQYYIRHTDLQVPQNGTAYFGPFSKEEIAERANDTLADMFAGSGNVDVVRLSRRKAKKMYINPRSFWMKELKLWTQ